MPCKRCASDNQSEFCAEMAIHFFPGDGPEKLPAQGTSAVVSDGTGEDGA